MTRGDTCRHHVAADGGGTRGAHRDPPACRLVRTVSETLAHNIRATEAQVFDVAENVAELRLAADGDTVICVRLGPRDVNALDLARRTVTEMFLYCVAAGLSPRSIVVADAAGSCGHADRADLRLVEEMIGRGDATRVLWRDRTAISRSLECASTHVTALVSLDVELHLLRPRGRVELLDHTASVVGWRDALSAERPR